MLFALAKNLAAGLLFASLIQATLSSLAHADSRPDTFKALESDSADFSCQVILRSASLKRDPNTGLPQIETDAVGQSWYAFESVVDAALAPMSSGTTVYLLYKSSDDSQWHTAPGMAVEGAKQSLQRLNFKLSHSTLMAGADISMPPPADKFIQVIPYLQTPDGRRIFDHNSNRNINDTVSLGASNGWTFENDAALCPSAGRGSSTLRFLGNWMAEQRGQPQPGQSIFVDYDLGRLPQCQSSSYNGLPAWQTEAFIRFFPSGEEFSASLNSLQNGKMMAAPARFEIPADSTHAQLWFKSRGRNCESVWDSNYGRNYELTFRADVAPAPAWAGLWRRLSGTNQCFALTKSEDLLEDASLTEDDLKSCHAIEAEVLVPGLTTSVETTPEAIQAQVKWTLDGIPQRPQWLTFAGRSGQNYRFRWILPVDTLKQNAWAKIDYSFQFSTDGLFWLNAGRASSNQNGIVSPRSIQYRSFR